MHTSFVAETMNSFVILGCLLAVAGVQCNPVAVGGYGLGGWGLGSAWGPGIGWGSGLGWGSGVGIKGGWGGIGAPIITSSILAPAISTANLVKAAPIPVIRPVISAPIIAPVSVPVVKTVGLGGYGLGGYGLGGYGLGGYGLGGYGLGGVGIGHGLGGKIYG